MMSHCFVPCAMLKGEIRPVFKAGKTSKTDSDNYRPVMNSSMFSEAFGIFDFACVKK